MSGTALLVSLAALSGGCAACLSNTGVPISDAGFCEMAARMIFLPLSLLAILIILVWRLGWPAA